MLPLEQKDHLGQLLLHLSIRVGFLIVYGASLVSLVGSASAL
jgi:hypothetical protein